MSLESYKKTIETQRKRDAYLNYLPTQTSSINRQREVDVKHSYKLKYKKSGINKLIFTVITLSILLVAAFRNPTESEAKTMIKKMVTEKVNEEMRQKFMKGENIIGSTLAMLLAPSFIDILVQTNVSDYIFFSTFNANVIVEEEKKTLVSGIIIFGSVFPLKSDIYTEFMD